MKYLGGQSVRTVNSYAVSNLCHFPAVRILPTRKRLQIGICRTVCVAFLYLTCAVTASRLVQEHEVTDYRFTAGNESTPIVQVCP